jgi:tripartite-type tricarboxylate transporter receptor subunit TctC
LIHGIAPEEIIMKKLMGCLLLLAASAVHAQPAYPAQQIRVLVPFAPGGAVDTAARVLTQKMSERLGWNFIVDNRPGGNGFIAVTAAAKAPPDGYTLLMASAGEVTLNPALFPNAPYDVDRDLVPITMVSDSPMLFLANAAAPFNSFQELITAAKAKPGTIAYSSAGAGSMNHLAGEWLALAAGIKLIHVPYKGGSPAAAAIAAGDVQFGVAAIPGAIPHIQSGKAKVIGLTTAKRSPLDRSWTTPRDSGVPDVDVSIWVGLLGPKGIPQAIVDKLNAEVRKTLEAPDVQKRFADLGGESAGMTQADFTARIRNDALKYKAIVQTAGMKAE